MKEFKLPNMADEKTVLKTVRMKLSTIQQIEELAKKNNMSINRLINECIEFALDNLRISNFKEDKKKKETL